MKKLLLLLVVSTLFTSCYHIYYSPNSVNAPLLAEKDDVRLNMYYTSGNESSFQGGELQFAYAPTNHFGVMINGFAAGRTENTGDYNESGHGSYAEVGGGYFTALDMQRKLIFETYAGVGAGAVENDYGLGDRSRVGIGKIFIQPSLGYRSRYFEVALATKFSHVTWNVKEMTVSASEHGSDLADLEGIRGTPSVFRFEPGLFVRAGAKSVKAHLGLSFTSRNTSSAYSNLSESLNLSLGFSFLFNAKKSSQQ